MIRYQQGVFREYMSPPAGDLLVANASSRRHGAWRRSALHRLPVGFHGLVTALLHCPVVVSSLALEVIP
jgi:hypothetical protein